MFTLVCTTKFICECGLKQLEKMWLRNIKRNSIPNHSRMNPGNNLCKNEGFHFLQKPNKTLFLMASKNNAGLCPKGSLVQFTKQMLRRTVSLLKNRRDNSVQSLHGISKEVMSRMVFTKQTLIVRENGLITKSSLHLPSRHFLWLDDTTRSQQ